MAVKASGTITLAAVTDVDSVTPYYKAQTSTLTPPSKPTSVPPSGWSAAQPTVDTSKTCYIVWLNEYSDGTWDYSDVSSFSEYEAAKAAQATADSALTAAQATQQYFWADNDGAHVTRIPKDQFLQNPSGKNALVDSDGMDIKDATTSVARFGASGSRIGKSGEGYLHISNKRINFYSGASNTSQAYIGRYDYEVDGGTEYFFARFGEVGDGGNINVRTNPISNGGVPIPRINIYDGTNTVASLYKDDAYDSDPDYEEGYSGSLRLGGTASQNRGLFINGISRPNVNDASTRQGIGIIDVQGNSDSYLDMDLRGVNKIRLTPDEVMITSGGKTTYYNNDGVVHSSAGAARIKAENYSTGMEIGMVSDASSQIGLYDYTNSEWIVRKTSNETYCGGRTMSALLSRSHFTTTQHSASTGSIAADSYSSDKTATFTKSGYYPYGIVGVNIAGTNRVHQNLYTWRLSSRSAGSATVTYSIRNRASAAFSGTVYFDILWIEVL